MGVAKWLWGLFGGEAGGSSMVGVLALLFCVEVNVVLVAHCLEKMVLLFSPLMDKWGNHLVDGSGIVALGWEVTRYQHHATPC